MLEVTEIHTFYGMSHILFGVSLNIDAEEIVCLLGRNGAGKTTTLRSIMSFNPPSQGSIKFKGREITSAPPYVVARQGIGYVPQGRRIFADLTVSENLEIVERKVKRNRVWNRDNVYELFPALRGIARRKGGYLSGGEQQMLTFARALMTNPEILLLDEPTEGLAPSIVKVLEEQIMKLKQTGVSILLVEHNMKSSLKICDRGYVIDNGRICYQGNVKELRENEEIIKRYLLI
jgi:branched-chain amino acid transport system ATP-binding protein